LDDSAGSGLEGARFENDLFVLVHVAFLKCLSALPIVVLELLRRVLDRVFDNQLHRLQEIIERKSTIRFHWHTAQGLASRDKFFEQFVFWRTELKLFLLF